MKLLFTSFVTLDKNNRWWITVKLPNTHDCKACRFYRRNNRRHGYCNLFKSDTCAEASCSLYQYLTDTKRL